MEIKDAVAVLDSVEFYMDGGVQRAPEPQDYQEALRVVKDALGIKEPEAPRITWDERQPIVTKARKSHGIQYPSQPTGAYAEIGTREDGRHCIRITGTVWNKAVDRVFTEGDTVSYDSYNLIYLGVIQKITNKRVTILPRYGQHNRSLDLNEFSWRNHDLDLDRVDRMNHETSMSI